MIPDLIVLVERQLAHTPHKQQVLHTITADNGKEFAYHEKIAQALDVQVYFAYPYYSWEKRAQTLNVSSRLKWMTSSLN